MRSASFLSILALSMASCNPFSPFDSPTSDAQLLSTARACFDQGDLACAQENYELLSDSAAAVASSELVFVLLAQAGINIGTFLDVFGSGDFEPGSAISAMTTKLIDGAGEAKRLLIYEAYQHVASIDDQNLRGLARFITMLSFISEIFAEDAGADGDATAFTSADFVQDPTACAATSVTSLTCITALSGDVCTAPSNAVIENGSEIDLDTTEPTGAPTLFMIDSAITKLQTALEELGAAGDFGAEGLGGFTEDITGSAVIETAPECYRNLLLSLGIGG